MQLPASPPTELPVSSAMELPAWTPNWLRTVLAKALSLLDVVVVFFRDKLYFLRSWSPTHAPTSWIYINGACCILTFTFFLLGWMEDQSIGYQFALAWYIPYNLLICVIWFAEAGLWMLFDEASPAWHKLGEVGLAFFFVFDGIAYLYEWKVLGDPLHRNEILIYTVIDFLIYLFYLALAIREEAKGQVEQQKDEQREVHDIETGENTGKETSADFKLLS